MNEKKAIVYSRWACEPDAKRRQEQRSELVRAAEEEGYSVEVVEEVGQPGAAFSVARAGLAAGESQALFVTTLHRISRDPLKVKETLTAAEEEGWRIVTLHPKVDTDTVEGRMAARCLTAFNLHDRWRRSVAAKRAHLAKRNQCGAETIEDLATIAPVRAI